jgi:hypothetical protein
MLRPHPQDLDESLRARERDRQRRALDAETKRITRQMLQSAPLRRWRAPLLALFCVVFIGLGPGFWFDRTFVFAYSATYLQLAIPIGVLASVVLAWLMARSPFWNAQVSARHCRTPWVRKLVWAPMHGAMTAAGVLYAPLGWIAIHGHFAGEPVTAIPAVLTELEPRRDTGRGCRHRGRLAVAGNDVRLCLTGIRLDSSLRSGSKVLLDGLQTPLGLQVEVIRRLPSS